MKILITNDDGIYGLGIVTLAKVLSEKHEVVVVAPKENYSAASRKINIREPFEVKKVDLGFNAEAYALDGSPCDCIDFAIGALGVTPDLVLSGINDGMNVGCDYMYSGTIGAAMEGGFLGFPALAVSVFPGIAEKKRVRVTDFSVPANYIADHLDHFLSLTQDRRVLNVNVPVQMEIVGERSCPFSRSEFARDYVVLENGKYLRQGVPPIFKEVEKDTDLDCLLKGFVTITPVSLDFADHTILEKWKA